jgi:Flp pilus assembly pilin Flp
MKRYLLAHDESGATMVEYALMAALIAVLAVAAVALLGRRIGQIHSGNQASVSAAMDKACTDGGGTLVRDAQGNVKSCTVLINR